MVGPRGLVAFDTRACVKRLTGEARAEMLADQQTRQPEGKRSTRSNIATVRRDTRKLDAALRQNLKALGGRPSARMAEPKTRNTELKAGIREWPIELPVARGSMTVALDKLLERRREAGNNPGSEIAALRPLSGRPRGMSEATGPQDIPPRQPVGTPRSRVGRKPGHALVCGRVKDYDSLFREGLFPAPCRLNRTP